MIGPDLEGALVGVEELLKSVMIRDWLDLGLPVKREETMVGLEGLEELEDEAPVGLALGPALESGAIFEEACDCDLGFD